ncbi:MAG: tripartite tricarboxylate transporter substrate binding protein [Comamonadaceae bacterium]|nr:MAG: tripartite tricarboxylate transporter substrate binding protein [Comamonadaceae bacterium]
MTRLKAASSSLLRKGAAQGLLAAAFVALASATPVTHAAYPEKAVTIVISFPPAGATDVMARAVGQALAEDLGQPVVIENRAGAGGMIGLGVAARAAPDGYTLHLTALTNQAIADALYSNKPADLASDFVPVARIGFAPHALVVPASLPVNNVPELVAYLKASPGKYNFASQGTGTLSHLESELFMLRTGVKLEHIPYKGSSQALPELINGSSTMMFDSLTGSLPLVRGGRLKMLAVASSERVASLPEVPTVVESGVQGFEANNIFGIVAPKGTPPEAVKKLEGALQRVLSSRALVEKLAIQGANLSFASAATFADEIRSEQKTWRTVIEQAGVKIE